MTSSTALGLVGPIPYDTKRIAISASGVQGAAWLETSTEPEVWARGLADAPTARLRATVDRADAVLVEVSV